MTKQEEGNDGLMDYTCLVLNVSEVFALLGVRWRNLNQSEASFSSLSSQRTPVMIGVTSSHAGTFVACGKSSSSLVPRPSIPLLLRGWISGAGVNLTRSV
ncbi:hypothetical protein PBY51_015592 [Eleginops maclovinus]|uniref:Uncharacterized protein n=1 Tax=Eleginops maclovinus TaxID=56733 RepID=A0AAN8ALG1_ELEMC|nr:hypothetical protein PBY51_015592 [Eleginops maclovinus]